MGGERENRQTKRVVGKVLSELLKVSNNERLS